MSDFAGAIKYLGRTLARVATTAELQASQSLIKPTKYIEREKARVLKLQRVTFTLPAIINIAIPGGGTKAYIRYQYNFSFPQAFSILNYGLLSTVLTNCFLCVRWLDNGVVNRYALTDPEDLLNVPMYAGEQILPNFVIEVWQKAAGSVITHDYIVQTSLIVTPADANPETILFDVYPHTPVYNELFVNFDQDVGHDSEPIPTNYHANCRWLDNI